MKGSVAVAFSSQLSADAEAEIAERSMYFGGVGAARAEGEKLEAVADPRRAGGARIVTHHN